MLYCGYLNIQHNVSGYIQVAKWFSLLVFNFVFVERLAEVIFHGTL